jgi:hypothetical protein
MTPKQQLAIATDQHHQLHRLHLDIRNELSLIADQHDVYRMNPDEQGEWAQKVAVVYDLVQPATGALRPLQLARKLDEALAVVARIQLEQAAMA